MSRALNLARAGIGLTGDASGNVGLGISPGFKFDLKMSSASRTGGLAIRRSSNDNHQLGLWTDGGAMYFDAVTDNAAAAGVTVFRRSLDSGANFSENARFDSVGNFGLGTATPDIEGLGPYYKQLTIYNSNALYPGTLTFGTTSTSNSGGEIARIHFLNGSNRVAQILVKPDGSVNNSSFIGIHTSNAGSMNERVRITKDGYVGIGTTSPTAQLHVTGITNLGQVIHGSPTNTANDNSGCVILHKLGQSQGYQFSGTIAANSWTGNAMIVVNIIVDYTNDSVSYQVLSASTLNPATSPKTTLQLVKITYGGSSYLGVRKNGGGTATMMLSGCTQGNIAYPYEVSSYTVNSTIATLN